MVAAQVVVDELLGRLLDVHVYRARVRLRDALQPGLARKRRFFDGGWGDLRAVHAALDAAEGYLAQGLNLVPHPTPLQIQWRPCTEAGVPAGLLEGSFRSPFAALLPPAAQQARFLWVPADPAAAAVPPGEPGAPPAPAVGCVVHNAATGEEGFATRLRYARMLQRRGLGSVLLEAPFYGSRRPPGQEQHYIRTVADYMMHGLAIMAEGAAVMEHLEGLWGTTKFCATGFSYGAAMATGTALLAGNLCRSPVACVPYVGCESAAVFLSGVLRDEVAWEALLADPCPLGPARTREEAEHRLVEAFQPMNHWRMAAAAAKRSTGRGVVCSSHFIRPRNDFIIRPYHAGQAAGALEFASAQFSEESLPGGHVYAYFARYFGRGHVPGVVRAVSRL